MNDNEVRESLLAWHTTQLELVETNAQIAKLEERVKGLRVQLSDQAETAKLAMAKANLGSVMLEGLDVIFTATSYGVSMSKVTRI